MKRLTMNDWQTINAALAHYEADDLDTEAQALGISVAMLERRIAAARVKVHERLAPQ